jgi:RNA polymerase sigma factor (sigma-70 family)
MSLAVSKSKRPSFSTHVHQHIGALKAYCRSLTKSSWDADDLMQETLLKAFKSWKKNPRELSKAFFIRIASNTWIDQYRKKTLPIKENEDINDLKHVGGMNRDVIKRTLESALKQLSPKQRVTMLLTEGLGMTAAETAAFMGESVGGVKAALHRARKKLEDFDIDTAAESDEETMTPYINALNEGRPENIVQLYRLETGVPMMSSSNRAPMGLGAINHVVSENGMSYVLITITLKGGKQLTIPFYRKEWLAILANFEEGMESCALIA